LVTILSCTLLQTTALKTLANDFENLYSAYDPSAMEFAIPQGKTAGIFLS
jgi:hypothetical protein